MTVESHPEIDSVGDEIACDHVGALVEPDRKATGNVVERHVCDRGVEHLHESRDGNDKGDQIGIVSAGRRPLRGPA
jgi:hypothetical protein